MLKDAPSVNGLNKPFIPLESTWIEIDTDQFKKNLSIIKAHVKPRLYCLPIKANAYGHGLIPMAKLAMQCDIDYLAVSSLHEGIRLRQAEINCPILVLGAFQEDQIPDLIKYHLEFTISSLLKAQQVISYLESTQNKAYVHLEIETGMNRTGARPSTAKTIYDYLIQHPLIELKGIYSHLANSDQEDHPLNFKQQKLFENWIDQCPNKHLFHLANSSALVHQMSPLSTMVRPGLLSFGLYSKPLEGSLARIKPCFYLKSRVSYFKVVQKGDSIGYGSTYVAQKQTRIATIPIGYGDGYRRMLSNKARVLIRGQYFPVVGLICMDQLMVDIGDQEAYVGDEVVLVGEQGGKSITIQQLAEFCQTIPYEILTGFNERIARYYL